MFAGCILIIPAIMTVMSGSELFSARWEATPERFMNEAVMPFLQQFAILLVTLVVAFMAFRIGLRDREVVLDGKQVVIRWGARFALPIRRINAAELKEFAVKKEARYAITGRVNAPDSVRKMPDRWRLKAAANGRRINLGSYTTEADARDAIARIRST